MKDYTVDFGNELSDAIIDSFAKKAKPAICENRIVIMMVENPDHSTESVVTGNAFIVLGKIGELAIDVIKKLEKNMGKTFANDTLSGFISALKEVNERR